MRMRVIVSLVFAPFLASCDFLGQPKLKIDYPVVKVSERLYVVKAGDKAPSATNEGVCNNPAFVLTGKGVVVVDPGSSEAVGNWLVKKIRGVTAEPIVAVINTHSDGCHWAANHAIKAAYPNAVIYAHSVTRGQISAEATARWVKQVNASTRGRARGTKMSAPELEFEHEDTLNLRRMRFRLYHPDGSKSGTVVEIPSEGVVLVSDNAITDDLRRQFSESKYFIPAHGPF